MYMPTAPKQIRRDFRRGFIQGYRKQIAAPSRKDWWFYLGWIEGKQFSDCLSLRGARHRLLTTS